MRSRYLFMMRSLWIDNALDAAGDRLNGDFDFWAVRLRNGNYTWVRTGTYNNGVLTVFLSRRTPRRAPIRQAFGTNASTMFSVADISAFREPLQKLRLHASRHL